MDADKLRTLYEHRDEEFYEWRAFVEATGIDAILDELGFPRDRNANWYNACTGSSERSAGCFRCVRPPTSCSTNRAISGRGLIVFTTSQNRPLTHPTGSGFTEVDRANP
jgi:hypothetical protein